jgi:transposase
MLFVPGVIAVVRYGDGGGLNAAGRAKREQVRLRAAGMFAEGVTPAQVAVSLEVSEKSAYAWHRAWTTGGTAALESKGSPGRSARLTEVQQARLEQELAKGPSAAGYADQRWTLARVAALIWKLFRVRYSLKGTSLVLQRMGWTVQTPTTRAAERDETAIAHWRRYTWAAVKDSRAGWARGSSSPTSRPKR